MATKARYVTDAQLTVIGRRYGSDAVALEANETVGRWQRDLGVLAGYGFGQAGLDAFTTDLRAHEKLRGARPDAVADKRSAVAAREKQVSMAWAWVDRGSAMLGVLARSDQTVSNALAAAMPPHDAALDGGIRALATILVETKDRLPADAQAGERLVQVDSLCSGLQTSPAVVQTSKGQTIADTAQIDLMDGKLWVRMRDLNAAARSAIRNGDLPVGLSEYSFHHLKHSGNPSPAPTPPAPAP
jgi:hypothetical protein